MLLTYSPYLMKIHEKLCPSGPGLFLNEYFQRQVVSNNVVEFRFAMVLLNSIGPILVGLCKCQEMRGSDGPIRNERDPNGS